MRVDENCVALSRRGSIRAASRVPRTMKRDGVVMAARRTWIAIAPAARISREQRGWKTPVTRTVSCTD
jgi:hypothetical protein